MARGKKKQRLLLLTTIALLIVAAGAGVLWWQRHNLKRSVERSMLPPAVEYDQIETSTSTPLPTTAATPGRVSNTPPPPTSAPDNTGIPAEINLAVPFTVQAPHANWDLPYKEFCEEASVLMAMSYLTKQTLPTADIADQRMEEIRAFEEQRFGYYEDTDIEDTATIIREYYKNPNVKIVENPTVLDIKKALAAGKPVIAPAAGRLLGNPHFQTPGPLYHMFVIKGYTANGKFITNDPGTRHGADFLYDESTIMNAMHDWRSDAKVEQGRKAILIVG